MRIGRHLVVLLVGAHLAVITLQALPSPGGGLARADWAQPTVQGELRAWSARLGKLGVEMEPARLEELVYNFAVSYHRVHAAAMAPFRGYYQYAGTGQSWRMFVAPHRYPARLQILVSEGDTFNLVYEERHPTANWAAGRLDHDRFRAALFRYGWGKKYPRQFGEFVSWISREAAADFPMATHVEVRFVGGKTPTPEQTRRGERAVDTVVRSKTVRVPRP